MDYLAFDPTTRWLWVPAGNSGRIDVIDTVTGVIQQIGGLPTAEITNGERKRTVGPSSATVGIGTVYVGNRADATICAFDAKTREQRACGHVPSMPDAVSYVANTKEVWTTTPNDNTIRVLDATTLAEKASIALTGAPEGYAVDARRGLFYTNLEDGDRTLAFDVHTKKQVANWASACGEAGPRGMVLDARGDYLFVACTDRVESLDVRHHGRIVSSVATGKGVDSIDYSSSKRQIFAGAAKSGDLTVIDVDRSGHLKATAHVITSAGARNGVLAANGALYLAHSVNNELLVVSRTP